jgi:hypothetical protein
MIGRKFPFDLQIMQGGFGERYGTISEQWKQIQSERWLNSVFEDFVKRDNWRR